MLKAFAKDHVDPVLTAVGFGRKGLVWNRPRAGFVDVIDLQIGKASEPRSEHFTVNVGVFVPEFYRIVWQKEPPRQPLEVDCVVRSRVGWLLTLGGPEKARDKWWRLDSGAEDTTCRREVPHALTSRVLPFLGTFESVVEIHSFLERERSPYCRFVLRRLYLAIARHRVGDPDGALQELRSIGHEVSDAWSPRVQAVERTLFPQAVVRSPRE